MKKYHSLCKSFLQNKYNWHFDISYQKCDLFILYFLFYTKPIQYRAQKSIYSLCILYWGKRRITQGKKVTINIWRIYWVSYKNDLWVTEHSIFIS